MTTDPNFPPQSDTEKRGTGHCSKAVPDEQVEAGAVSEEAVEALLADLRLAGWKRPGPGSSTEDGRTALEAALPHLHPTPDPGLSEEERSRLRKIADTIEASGDLLESTPTFLRFLADRSNQPDSSKAGGGGEENSQAEEQSDDKAAHPPAVGGEAELREAVRRVVDYLGSSCDDPEDWPAPCGNPAHLQRHNGDWICPHCCSSWWALSGEEPELHSRLAAFLRATLASTQPQVSCSRCGGEGLIEGPLLDGVPHIGPPEPCPDCNGTGQESGEAG